MDNQAWARSKCEALKEAAWGYKMALYRAIFLWLTPDQAKRLLADPILDTAHNQLLDAIRVIDADIFEELDARNAWKVGARLGRMYPPAGEKPIQIHIDEVEQHPEIT